jgi:hypothetical protein
MPSGRLRTRLRHVPGAFRGAGKRDGTSAHVLGDDLVHSIRIHRFAGDSRRTGGGAGYEALHRVSSTRTQTLFSCYPVRLSAPYQSGAAVPPRTAVGVDNGRTAWFRTGASGRIQEQRVASGRHAFPTSSRYPAESVPVASWWSARRFAATPPSALGTLIASCAASCESVAPGSASRRRRCSCGVNSARGCS